jgi:hypothetical protein
VPELGVGGDECLEPERPEGSPLSVTIVISGRIPPSPSRGASSDNGRSATLADLGQGQLDRGDRVVLVRGRDTFKPISYLLR